MELQEMHLKFMEEAEKEKSVLRADFERAEDVKKEMEGNFLQI